MLVRIIRSVDDDIFLPLLAEVSKIKWETIADPRSRHPIFATSRSIGLRIQKVGPTRPTNLVEWGEILDCIDFRENKLKYPNCYKVATKWMLPQIGGLSVGRVMIVNLLPGGCVAPHVDAGNYFIKYSRFHIPLITNSQVVFSRDENTIEEHMLAGCLYQLNNLDTHMVKNNSNQSRIHIIADIEVPGGNYIF